MLKFIILHFFLHSFALKSTMNESGKARAEKASEHDPLNNSVGEKRTFSQKNVIALKHWELRDEKRRKKYQRTLNKYFKTFSARFRVFSRFARNTRKQTDKKWKLATKY